MLVITRGYSLGEWSIPTVNLETCGCWTLGKLPRWPRSVVWTERVGPESPSGYVKHSYWTWPFIVDFTMKNGGSFHSYVSLPDIIHNVYVPTHTHTLFSLLLLPTIIYQWISAHHDWWVMIDVVNPIIISATKQYRVLGKKSSSLGRYMRVTDDYSDISLISEYQLILSIWWFDYFWLVN